MSWSTQLYVSILIIASSFGSNNLCTGKMINLALNKPASQSGTTYGGVASRAVNGNRTNEFYANGGCTHTDEIEWTWWMVDLGKQYTITSIAITNRKLPSAYSRLRNFSVEMSTVDPSKLDGFPLLTQAPKCITQYKPVSLGATYFYRCPRPIPARYIRVVKYSAIKHALSLCEFEAYAARAIDTWMLTRMEDGNGEPDVIETLKGTHSVTQCARACVQRNGGKLCQFIQVHKISSKCRLLAKFKPTNIATGNEWDLFSLEW